MNLLKLLKKNKVVKTKCKKCFGLGYITLYVNTGNGGAGSQYYADCGNCNGNGYLLEQ